MWLTLEYTSHTMTAITVQINPSSVWYASAAAVIPVDLTVSSHELGRTITETTKESDTTVLT